MKDKIVLSVIVVAGSTAGPPILLAAVSTQPPLKLTPGTVVADIKFWVPLGGRDRPAKGITASLHTATTSACVTGPPAAGYKTPRLKTPTMLLHTMS